MKLYLFMFLRNARLESSSLTTLLHLTWKDDLDLTEEFLDDFFSEENFQWRNREISHSSEVMPDDTEAPIFYSSNINNIKKRLFSDFMPADENDKFKRKGTTWVSEPILQHLIERYFFSKKIFTRQVFLQLITIVSLINANHINIF